MSLIRRSFFSKGCSSKCLDGVSRKTCGAIRRSLHARSLRIEPLEDRTLLSLTTVTTALDVVDADDGVTSLREAITYANTNPGDDTVEFDSSLAGKTITLTGGQLNIEDATGKTSITGLGDDLLTLSGNNASRVFYIASDATAAVSGLTITQGYVGVDYGGAIANYGSLTIDSCVISASQAVYGGGLYNGDIVTIHDCTFTGNTGSFYGGAILNGSNAMITDSTITDNTAGWGGGVYCSYDEANLASVTLTMNNCAVTENQATNADGGGLYIYGVATVTDCSITNNTASSGGGGVNNFGTLSISDSVISGNSAGEGGGIASSSSTYNGVSIQAVLTITNCDFSENTASNVYGGGISQRGENTTLTIIGSSFSNNTASAYGGGVSLFGGSATISECGFSENEARMGGGMYINPLSADDEVAIADCTFSDNTAASDTFAAYGGGLFSGGISTVVNCTFSGNTAVNNGGAIFNNGTLTLVNCTIANNQASTSGSGIYTNATASATTTLANTIVADNTAATDGSADIYGTVTANFCLIEDVTGATFSDDSADNITGVDPLLGPLGNYGGETQTIPLLAGSPAINAGSDHLIPDSVTTDQRGKDRIVGDAVDIGAYESPMLFEDIDAIGINAIGYSAAAWGDYDNDGRLDVLLVGNEASSVKVSKIYHNDGDGVFHAISAGLAGVWGGSAAWGDYDNDGHLDVLITGVGISNTATTLLYHNNGDGSFQSVPNSGLLNVSGGSATFGDYNNDGLVDVLLTGMTKSGSYVSKIYRNGGNGVFSDISTSLIGVRDGQAVWGDYDNDGQLDVLLTGTENDNTTYVTLVYHNDGNGVFRKINAGLAGVWNGSVAFGDYDNDGLLDILLTGNTQTSSGRITRVYHNDGGDRFHNIGATLTGGNTGSAAWGDYDNDGLLDILVTGHNGSAPFAKLYHNDGGNAFHEISAGLAGVWIGSAVWADYDSDGRLDILVDGSDASLSPVAKIYHNNTLTADTAPEVPTALTAQALSATSVLLSWTAPTDVEMSSAGLSYSIRVGTTPGGCDVVDSTADADGFRQLAQRGAIQGTSWTLDSLTANQTYYWSVQAVDTSLVGSFLAEEGSFLIDAVAPTVTLTAPALTNDSTPAITATVSDAGSGVPDGATVYLDMDLNDDGDFTDDGETGYATAAVSGDAATFNIATAIADGTYGMQARVADVAGNKGTSDVATMVVDTTAPRVTINQAADQPDPATDTTMHFTVVFSEPVADFTLSGVVLSGTTIVLGDSRMLTATITGSGTTYDLAVTGSTHSGTVVADLMIGAAHDAAGNANSAPTSDDNSIQYTAPFEDSSSLGITGAMNGSIAWGDYDDDGLLDVLISGDPYAGPRIYHNEGDNTFTEISADFPWLQSGQAAWGDYDNDGLLDVVASGWTGQEYVAAVYHNDGNSVFTDIEAGLTGAAQGSVAWGDYDNDGLLDILETGTNGTTYLTKLYHNDGNGGFHEVAAALPGVVLGSASWGDYDNDGCLDILVVGAGGGPIAALYHNDGNGVFHDVSAGFTGVQYNSAAWGDYDNDGYLDVLMTGAGTDGPVTALYHNDGNGFFHDVSAGLQGVIVGSAAWGDYDNDGDLDILLTGWDGNQAISVVYRNDDNGEFHDISAGLVGAAWSSAAWGDCDRDGRLDILAAGNGIDPTGDGSSYTVFTKIYHNNGAAANTAPTAPTGLAVAEVSTTSVTLSWDASSDAETSSTGLSYSIRVGTTPGGCDVVYSTSDADGLRQLAQRGEIQGTSWTFDGFTANQRYYWSVQAVDTSLAGSPFAEEGSFVIDTLAPTVVLVPSITNDTTPSISVTVSDAGSGVADGTPIYLDVDLNIDGDFNDDGEAGYTTATVTDGAATFDVAPVLAEGTYNLQARVSDAAGNEGASATETITIDTTPPNVYLESFGGWITNNNSPLISANTYGDIPIVYQGVSYSFTVGSDIPVGSTVFLDVDLNNDGDFADAGETAYASATFVSQGWYGCSAAFNVAPLADGVYNLRARAFDAAGNEGTSAVKSLTVDTVAPIVTLTAPALTNDNTPSIPATVSDAGSGVADGATIYLDVDLNNDGDFADAGEAGYNTATVADNEATFCNDQTWADGVYNFRVRVFDAAGNEGVSDVATVLIDTVAPVVAINVPTLTNDNTPSIGAVISDDSSGVADGMWVYLDVDLNNDGDYSDFNETNYSASRVSDGAASFRITPSLPDGSYHLHVRVYDVAGNECTTNVATMVVDTTAPNVTINQSSSQADPATSLWPSVNFTVVFSEPVNDFTAANVTLGGTAGATTAVVTGSGTTYNVAVSGITVDGTVVATIAAGAAHDEAGNAGNASTSDDNSVTCRIPPAIAGIVVAESSASNKNGKLESTDKLLITWAASSSHGIASQTMVIDDKVAVPVKGPFSNLYYYSNIGTQTVGVHTYTITTTDANGLSSSVVGTFTVVAPAPPTLAGAAVGESGSSNKNGKLEPTDKLTLTWIAKSDYGIASQTVKVGEKAIASVKSVAGTSYYYCSLGAWAVGTHAYTITTTDVNGRLSSVTGTFIVVGASTIPPAIVGQAVGEAGSSNKNGILETTDKLTLTWGAKSDNGVARQTITVDGETVGSAKPVAGTSYYYCSLGTWAAGTHSYVITTFDATGLSSSVSGSFTVLEAAASGVSSAMRAKLLTDVLDESVV